MARRDRTPWEDMTPEQIEFVKKELMKRYNRLTGEMQRSRSSIKEDFSSDSVMKVCGFETFCQNVGLKGFDRS